MIHPIMGFFYRGDYLNFPNQGEWLVDKISPKLAFEWKLLSYAATKSLFD